MATPASSLPQPGSPRRTKPDPFRFGWRYVQQPERNGRSRSVRVPLTPEDVLHPQEYDHIPENTIQEGDRTYLVTVLRSRLADTATTRVLSDCLVNWGVEGLRNHSPDLVVFENVADPGRSWTTFAVASERARPVLVIEIVSMHDDIVSMHDDAPRMRDNDVEIKLREYYQAGVPLYAIVDQEREGGPRRLLGYRRGQQEYVPLPLDEQGRLSLQPLGLLLGLRGNRAICFDAATGEEIPDLTGMTRARAAEAQARHQAEQAQAAEAQARQQAEQARQQAEAALATAQARIAELEAQAQRRRSPRKRGQ